MFNKKITYYLIILITVIAIILSIKHQSRKVNAEETAELWSRTFNGRGDGNDEAIAIAVDKDGNAYVTGRSFGDSVSKSDIATIKYNRAGNLLWTAYYNGPANKRDQPAGIKVDADSNVYVVGTSQNGEGTKECIVIKYNSKGNELSVKDCTMIVEIPTAETVVDRNGNIYVANTGTNEGRGIDCILNKYDSGGILLWSARYEGQPGNPEDIPIAVAVDSSDNVYVAGNSSYTRISNYYFLVKYSSDGKELWRVTYNSGDFSAKARGMALSYNKNNIYLIGATRGTETDYDFLVIKYAKDPIPKTIAELNVYIRNKANEYYKAEQISNDANLDIQRKTAFITLAVDMLEKERDVCLRLKSAVDILKMLVKSIEDGSSDKDANQDVMMDLHDLVSKEIELIKTKIVSLDCK